MTNEMEKEFTAMIRDAGYGYGELEALEERFANDPAYWDNQHPLHREAVAKVNAIRSVQAIHDQGRQAAAERQETERLERQQRELGDLTEAKRRQIVQLYGPKEGKDTPSYRQKLPENVRRVVDKELGEAQNMDPDPLGLEESGEK